LSLQLIVGPLTPDEITRAVSALAAAGINVAGNGQVGVQGQIAPPARPTALPPVPPPGGAPAAPAAPAAPPAPPPPPQPAAPPQSPLQQQVVHLMDAYSKAGHGIAGVRKVLAVCGLQRAQDANEEQLRWLAEAFANTAWAP